MFGYRAIRRHGVWLGLVALRRRFARCADALRTWPPGLARQRGFCDAGCDLPVFDCASGALDGFACCDDCGDWGGRKKPKADPTPVDLPPIGPPVR